MMKRIAVGLLCGVGAVVSGSHASGEPSKGAPKIAPAAPGPTIVVPGPAPAKKVLFVVGSEGWTDISGHGGEGKSYRSGPSAHDVALRGMELGESSDDPNFAQAKGKYLDTALDTLVGPGYSAQIPGGTSSADKEIAFTARKLVRGVAVCTGDEKDTAKRKLKGLKLFYATVSTAAVVDPVDATGTSWERPNCKIWHPARFCGPDKVARAARLLSDKDDKWFQGVQLECMKPELR